MLDLLPKGITLCDMFCGVGPLAIRAAKERNCKVLANDLNPDCFVYLKKNIDLNKVGKKVIPFNMDARAFVRKIVYEDNKEIPKDFLHFDHVYMNLPVDAVEFLDVFCGLFEKADKNIWNYDNLPIIHVYAFTEQEEIEEAKKALCARINKIFGKYKELALSDIIGFHQIRDVSAKSKMYAVSFKLSKEIAFNMPVIPKKHDSEELKENAEILKKSKTDNE